MNNSFNTKTSFDVSGNKYEIYSLEKLSEIYPCVHSLPYSLKILLENQLRHEDGVNVSHHDIEVMANWDATAQPSTEISFTPSRVILQDFTGVPAVVDLAAMRDAMKRLGGDPNRINPLSPAELVVDHSVQVDVFGQPNAAHQNTEIEYQRNRERYTFLRWGQKALNDFRVVPPNTGIVHQVNLEYLARVIFSRQDSGRKSAFPDTVVGTDSHTTMINGLGVLGWGVGGIEAEAAMLGQPITMLIPQVVGFELVGQLPEGATATDLVLQIVEILRKHGVVGKFVEFFGDGLDFLPLADRATIANMAPEYGATCGIFPIDKEVLHYLQLSGRSQEHIALVEQYSKTQGLLRESLNPATYSELLKLDMGSVEPSLAGPKRPQDRISLRKAKATITNSMDSMLKDSIASKPTTVTHDGETFTLRDGAVVIAAITSCTNTSNPAVMLGAGLLAKKAVALGLRTKPWVKTSLAPGSKVVRDYLTKADVVTDLEKLGFHIVGYGCTTCIGNSGPLPNAVRNGIQDGNLIASSILSGNRNFEGRIHSDVKMNFLASPPLVVAFAIAGRMDIDLYEEPLAKNINGEEIYLKDIWPSQKEIQDVIETTIDSAMFESSYSNVFEGDDNWKTINVTESELYQWDPSSTYIKHPPYFERMTKKKEELRNIHSARVLALLGDSITTDHISPAGAIKHDSPAGEYLIQHGVEASQFNSYGSRRGNHEVMMRGTFANVRLRNQLVTGTEGGWTIHIPTGQEMSIFDAAMLYKESNVPLLIIGGKEYGSGSSRDWAAKGTNLLGVKAVLVESFERIHRSNLIGMGVLPLQFKTNETAATLGLNGRERYDIEGIKDRRTVVTITATDDDGLRKSFEADVRIDTPKEWEYFCNGGILHFVLRQLAAA